MSAIEDLNLMPYPLNFEDLFRNGMKRSCGYIESAPEGEIIDLGASEHRVLGATHFGRDIEDGPGANWEAPILPIDNGEIAAVHTYHFLEHLRSEKLARMMQEIERVLMVGGLVYMCVPWAGAGLAFANTEHESFWNEESLRHLGVHKAGETRMKYHSAVVSQLVVDWLVIAGITSFNMAMLAQLRKVA